MHFWLRLILKLALVILTATSVSAQELKEVFAKKIMNLDTAFTSQCNLWDAQTPRSDKVQFGPFETISVKKEKPVRLYHHSSWLGNHTVKNTSRRFSMVALYNDRDSIFIDMDLFIYDENDHDRETHSTMVTGAKIRLRGDTTTWNFFPDTVNDYRYGDLVAGDEMIRIIYVYGMKDLQKAYKNYPTGFMFKKEQDDLAALQYERHYFVWMHNRTDEKTKMLIGAFIVAFLAGSES